MPVNPGALKHRVTVLEADLVNEPLGALREWTPAGTRWGLVTPISVAGAGEYSMAGTTDVTHVIVLRHDERLNLTLGRTRFRVGRLLLEPRQPPEVTDLRDRFVRIACRMVPGEEEGAHGRSS